MSQQKIIMLPCNYNCSLCDILQINKRQLADLNQVREYLDDLCYHEPTCHQEVTAKLNIVNGMLRHKLAEARHLISSIEFGCDVCHPDQGMAYE